MRSLFLWHQISGYRSFNLNATPKLHLPENFQLFTRRAPHNKSLWKRGAVGGIIIMLEDFEIHYQMVVKQPRE